MSTVYIYEVDAGPAGMYWEGVNLPDDYPITTWTDMAQLGRDIMELSGEGHEVIVRSHAWFVTNNCHWCGTDFDVKMYGIANMLCEECGDDYDRGVQF
jgi:hypothetical protein